MFPGMNPKKMQSMMSKMGIAQNQIDANRVIIETDKGNTIIENPSVVKIDMQGNVSFQISGDIKEEATEESKSEDPIEKLKQDIQTVVEKTGCSEEEAAIELEKTGDFAEAIINLTK